MNKTRPIIRPGRDGRDGRDGKDGETGIEGRQGRPGINGRDGRDGEKGDRGEKGDPGQDAVLNPPEPWVAQFYRDGASHQTQMVEVKSVSGYLWRLTPEYDADGLLMRTAVHPIH